MAAIRAGTAMGSAASSAYQMGQATSGGDIAAGVGGVARATGGVLAQKARSMVGRAGESLSRSAQSGREAAWRATGGSPTSGMSAGPFSSSGAAPSSPPRWAQRLRAEQAARTHRHATAQAIKDGDRPGAAANPDLSSKED
jgi:type IV secretion system protein TrbL